MFNLRGRGSKEQSKQFGRLIRVWQTSYLSAPPLTAFVVRKLRLS